VHTHQRSLHQLLLLLQLVRMTMVAVMMTFEPVIGECHAARADGR